MENFEFKELCKKYNLDISSESIDMFAEYYNYLIQENLKYNLTAITDKRDVYLKHFLDSLLGYGCIGSNNNILDIGSGAGFPSIPLAIYDKSNSFTLIDSVNKKINFINNLKSILKLNNVNAIHTRCEDYALKQENREKFDVVVCRAVAPVNVLLEYCMPFLKVGGKCVMYKGSNYENELNMSTNAISLLKCKIIDIKEVYFDEIDAKRSFIIFEKLEKTSKKYPRLQNKVRKQPL